MAMSSLSPLDAEILSVWEAILPINLVRLYQRLLPDPVTLPKRTATGAELLEFYDRMQPPEIRGLVETVRGLEYPVLDPRHLAEQLTRKSGGLGASGSTLMSSLSWADFPLKGIASTLNVVLVRTSFDKFRWCVRNYNKCIAQAETERAEAECEREYQKCAAIWELRILLILLREWVPELVPPGPRPPWILRSEVPK